MSSQSENPSSAPICWSDVFEAKYAAWLDAERALLDGGALGRLARVAAISPQLRCKLDDQPDQVLEYFGIEKQEGVEVRFVRNTSAVRYVLLPELRFESTREDAKPPAAQEQSLGGTELSDEDLGSQRPQFVRFLRDDFRDVFANSKADIGPAADLATADRTSFFPAKIGDDLITDVTGFDEIGAEGDLSAADTRTNADVFDTGKD